MSEQIIHATQQWVIDKIKEEVTVDMSAKITDNVLVLSAETPEKIKSEISNNVLILKLKGE